MHFHVCLYFSGSIETARLRRPGAAGRKFAPSRAVPAGEIRYVRMCAVEGGLGVFVSSRGCCFGWLVRVARYVAGLVLGIWDASTVFFSKVRRSAGNIKLTELKSVGAFLIIVNFLWRSVWFFGDKCHERFLSQNDSKL